MPMSTSLSGREVPFARLPNSHTSRTLLVRAAHCRINSTLSAGRSIVPPIFLLLAFDGWRCRRSRGRLHDATAWPKNSGIPARLLDFACSDFGDHDGRADDIGGALFTSGASGHY